MESEARASHGVTAEQIAEVVSLSRAKQGLPRKVEEPSTLENVATLLDLPDEVDAGRVEDSASPHLRARDHGAV